MYIYLWVHIYTCTNNGRVFKGGNKILANYTG